MGSDEAVCVNWVIVDVSIHAPTWGATEVVRAIRIGIPFQPTLPHGERRLSCLWLVVGMDVSIHAPTRGATYSSINFWLSLVCFNPRSHTGSDVGHAPQGVVMHLFQSTLPHGERRILHALAIRAVAVSIHAPTRGATGLGYTKEIDFVFQSTLPHGERLTYEALLRRIICFNPRSHTGSDKRVGTFQI